MFHDDIPQIVEIARRIAKEEIEKAIAKLEPKVIVKEVPIMVEKPETDEIVKKVKSIK